MLVERIETLKEGQEPWSDELFEDSCTYCLDDYILWSAFKYMHQFDVNYHGVSNGIPWYTKAYYNDVILPEDLSVEEINAVLPEIGGSIMKYMVKHKV